MCQVTAKSAWTVTATSSVHRGTESDLDRIIAHGKADRCSLLPHPLRNIVLGMVFCCELGTDDLGSTVPPCKAKHGTLQFSDLIIRLIVLK